ncbi:hypothetical protein HK100_010352 [Physocladia obscura]|uniref:Uncharacterized protein n=1 Tax=Physocladia obscura TaxID=109957 RepID=A0AAD5T3A2_9FUNG|nr:hypothetical protein HK100_010352 [Physocladia obscura]
MSQVHQQQQRDFYTSATCDTPAAAFASDDATLLKQKLEKRVHADTDTSSSSLDTVNGMSMSLSSVFMASSDPESENSDVRKMTSAQDSALLRRKQLRKPVKSNNYELSAVKRSSNENSTSMPRVVSYLNLDVANTSGKKIEIAEKDVKEWVKNVAASLNDGNNKYDSIILEETSSTPRSPGPINRVKDANNMDTTFAQGVIPSNLRKFAQTDICDEDIKSRKRAEFFLAQNHVSFGTIEQAIPDESFNDFNNNDYEDAIQNEDGPLVVNADDYDEDAALMIAIEISRREYEEKLLETFKSGGCSSSTTIRCESSASGFTGWDEEKTNEQEPNWKGKGKAV